MSDIDLLTTGPAAELRVRPKVDPELVLSRS